MIAKNKKKILEEDASRNKKMKDNERLVREFNAGKLGVKVYRDRQSMGEAAAKAVRDNVANIIAEKGGVSMVFASAPSQEEFLEALIGTRGIKWSRVVAFYLDEYINFPSEAPQAFGKFLSDRLFSKVKVGKVHYLNGNAKNLIKETERYAKLLGENGLDIACIGIGENGHLACNDPHVADFSDPLMVKIVELDEVCRQQQVNDGCFATIEDVPKKAITLTMPTIYNAKCISAVVPALSKAEATRKTVYGPISTSCPASILRQHENAMLFLDLESASLLRQ